MPLLFPIETLRRLTNSDNPKEEVLGYCVEICLGVLRTALMYEGHDVNLFGWNNINGVLMRLETSLMTFNATAHVSGADNGKMRSKRNKREETWISLTLKGCQQK